MKHLSAFLCLAALVMLPPFAISASADTAELQSQLRAAYLDQCDLIVKGDYNGFTNTMTPDFVNIGPDGARNNRDTVISMTKLAMQQIKLSTCDVTFANAMQNADGSVTAMVTETNNGAFNGAPLVSISSQTDTWVQQNGKWLLKGSHTNEETIKVNGTIVQHLGGPAPAPAASP